MNYLGLYIHIPFCNKLCPYCSFFSSTDKILETKYINKCIQEISFYRNKYKFDTVYIGGGTPSAIDYKLLDKLLSAIFTNLQINPKEITIEANPESVSKNFASVLKSYPVNRVSLGIQSFDDNVLSLLGRIHDSKTAIKACKIIREANINNLNLDIIYDIPTVPYTSIYETIKKTISLNPQHISAYSYMPDTGFLSDTPTDDPSQMNKVSTLLEKNSYTQYEVSNFSLTGYQGVHNKKYWEIKEYIGIGASAHSMIHEYKDNIISKRIRFGHVANIEKYINSSLEDYEFQETLSGKDLLIETLIFRLRLKEKFDPHKFLNKFGNISNRMNENIEYLIKKNFIEREGNLISITKKGINVMDQIMLFLMK